MRIVLGVEYDGAEFCGWQRQADVKTVQGALEQALSKIANQPIGVHCAGRTDAGVHATGQVVHFDAPIDRPDRAWTMGVNTNLPDGIAVRWVKRTGKDFHARFSAITRRYRYVIQNTRLRPGILNGGITHEYRPLDADIMHSAAQCLVGEHDYSAFRAAHCQSASPWRQLKNISVRRLGEYVVIDVEANAFLHHMVRNITGSLIVVGCKEKPEGWINTLLESRDRTQAAPTAKPHGLYLVQVNYAAAYDIPCYRPGPLFLS
ncbi:tRNA pseudouridine(38-40) synthase TruA [Alteromonas oceanisediminis]|uniref:tRNA pseudouridine(38-40) synthase TruA n=1 Tax=Alteromonas oceanisediminis TaxID=2836180 RepID=UPI001BDB375F|nr:tRNA pseudouridine(38-40) synthase TruA [Alteromonas oceanisediminis]MBT0587424.1 tRNA pseudouridine(38-40) synthase TruA [Alteromonas oceanisediminis]